LFVAKKNSWQDYHIANSDSAEDPTARTPG